MNIIIISGRTTREVEMSKDKNNNAIANFSVAVNGYNDKATFFNCTAFGKQAESLMNYLQIKGRVMVTGRMEQREYTAKDGSNQKVWNLIANQIEIIDFKDAKKETPVETVEVSEQDLDSLPW